MNRTVILNANDGGEEDKIMDLKNYHDFFVKSQGVAWDEVRRYMQVGVHNGGASFSSPAHVHDVVKPTELEKEQPAAHRCANTGRVPL